MLVYDEAFLSHRPSAWHVERPERLVAIADALRAAGLWRDLASPEAVARDDLLRVHTEAYLDLLETGSVSEIDPETTLGPETYGIATRAVGAAVAAAERAVREGRPWFALVRPPGHHAGPGYGGGFCYLNNVAVATARLRATGAKRVVILDYDAHHGNGTSDIFRSNPAVLYVSTHQWGIYPGTGPAEDVGEGDAEGTTVNVPFGAGCGDASFRAAWTELVEPICDAFRPEAVLVSLGVDAHYRDPITGLTLSSPGYVDLMRRTLEAARRWCGGRIAIVLEGGYHLAALSEVLAGTVGLASGVEVAMSLREVRDDAVRGREVIDAVRRVHGAYWNLR